MTQERNIYERLANLDSRVIFWIASVAIIIPLLSPIGLPLPISQYTRDMHTFLDDLPPGSVLGVAIDCSVGQWPSLEPGWVVFLKDAFSHDLKLIFWSMDSTGPRCLDLALAEMPSYIEGKEYGVDYAMFGYLPGVESAVASLASDTQGTLGADRYGTPVSEIPVMEGVETAEDFAAVFCYEQGVGSTTAYLRHWAEGKNVPYILGTSPGGLLDYLRFYPREVKGIMVGSLGAAEYELLINAPAKGLKMMDAQNIIHLLMIALLILGNVSYWGQRMSEKQNELESVQ